MKRNILLPVFIFLSSLLFAQQQQAVFEHYTVENGLTVQAVRCLYQDREGYIWVGTINTVQRFDGFNFKSYSSEGESKTNLTKGFDNVIFEDSKGYIWVATSSGLCKLDHKTDKFQQFAPADPSAPIFKFDFQSIFQDSKGILWAGANMGLNKMDSNFTKLEPFIPNILKDVLPNIAFKSINEDNNGILWFGSGIGLLKYNRNTNELTPVWIDPNPPALMSKSWNTGDYAIQSIFKDEKGILWTGSFGGVLLKINPSVGIIDSILLEDPKTTEKFPITCICSEDESKLWIATNSGLLLFDKISGTILVHYSYDENVKESLSDSRLNSVLKDRSGTLWVGTAMGGLNKLNRIKYPFKSFIRKSWGVDKSFVLVPFSDMTVSKSGSVFVGTATGIEEIKPGTNEIIKHEPNKAINVVMEDSRGNLWIAIKQYSGGGVFKRDTEGKLHPILDSAGNMFSKEIHCIFESRKGRIFFASEFYLYEIDPEKNNAALIFVTNRRIYKIGDNIDNTLCFGTLAGGAFFINPDTKTLIKHFMPDEKDPTSIKDNSMTDICFDSKDRLWLGSSAGLHKYERETGGFKVYDKSYGLASNTIIKIIEDNSGNIWLGTASGISKFNPETETFKNYDLSYGVVEGPQYACGKNKKGMLFFKTKTGITYFYPDSIKDNPFIPPVVITEMKVYNNPYFFDKEVKLSYSQNYISLEFAALSYISPEKNMFAYKMEGVDRDWVYPGNRRYASYTSLEPGNYTFHVKASNNDGVWNNEGTTLSIVISPPWYRTYWAYGLYVIIFISLVYSWRRYDLRRRDLKYQVQLEHESAQKEKEISQMKSRFFTNISHEFRTPLTLITGPAERIIEKTQDEEIQKNAVLMKKNAGHLLELVNQLLDISKLDEGKLKLKVSKGNLETFIRGIVSIFESYAEKKDVALKIKSQIADTELYFDREILEKILINIISNALKFTKEGDTISVTVSKQDDNNALIKIKDTGIGINAAELPKLFDRFYQVDSSHTRERGGTGIGLSLTKELVELHKGKISVDSVEGEWTEFTIILPVSLNNFKDDELILTQDKEQEEQRYLDLADRIETDLKSSLPSLVTENGKKVTDSGDGEKPIILIVEDNEDVRQYLRDVLEKEYEIEEAANGEQGYRRAEAIIPDLIIGDIMMPKIDGYEMTKKIRSDEKTFHIPIILLTAKSDHKSKLEGFESGAEAYLTKPFDNKELMLRIHNLIDMRKKLQEKFARRERIPVRDGTGGEKKISDLNERFINKVIEIMEKHITEEEFSIEEFGKELYMSRTQLHRKLKALTGKSASRYLRSFRLSAAKKMIEKKKGTISEIAYNVGFSSPIYFSKCFRDEYGYPPSEVT